MRPLYVLYQLWMDMAADPHKLEWQKLETEITQCRRCPRLVAWREEVAQTKRRAYQDWSYWGKPVPGFGDPQARVLVVGLAPGAHGSNRTGRMFTGDGSGDFLFPALYRAGFASQPLSRNRDDGMELKDLFISAVGRCAPPDNKPATMELMNCRPYLLEEIRLLKNLQGIVALGSIAYLQVMDIFRQNGHAVDKTPFQHGGLAVLGHNQPWLLASYHPSRQNTQTGRLTVEMFDRIWQKAQSFLSS